MLVHRLLDAFFRTLDAVDAARDRIDRMLGRKPRPDPWSVEWPPPKTDLAEEPPKNGAAGKAGSGTAQKAEAKKEEAKERAADEAKRSTRGAAQKTAKKGAKKSARAASATAKPKPTEKKPRSKGRKGSVDRAGKDFDSPRARAVWQYVQDHGLGVITEDADVDGKKVLGRVLWALFAAEQAGSEKGLTTADASALLHLAAGMEVFATNIGRACRDHQELIVESEPDGRNKRYKLTDAGRQKAQAIATRAP